uniref:Uncharacterized protein n=1 Tax=Saccharum spontaneum TaxID=62335 RepID=A0A678T6A4_SACSP|nr:hypothetical protein SS88P14_000006 [Saccharum spontaneum]
MTMLHEITFRSGISSNSDLASSILPITIQHRVPAHQIPLGHLIKQLPRTVHTSTTLLPIPVDQGPPGERVSLRHFVEQLLRGPHLPAPDVPSDHGVPRDEIPRDATCLVEHLPARAAVQDPTVEADERVHSEEVRAQAPPHGLGMNQESGPAARRAAAGLEDSGERVGVGPHATTAHPREVEQRGSGARGGMETDGGVPGEWVVGHGLREAREDGVRERGGAGNGREGEEEEVGEAQRGGGEVARGEEEGVALERVGGGPARAEAGEERRQGDSGTGISIEKLINPFYFLGNCFSRAWK